MGKVCQLIIITAPMPVVIARAKMSTAGSGTVMAIVVVIVVMVVAVVATIKIVANGHFVGWLFLIMTSAMSIGSYRFWKSGGRVYVRRFKVVLWLFVYRSGSFGDGVVVVIVIALVSGVATHCRILAMAVHRGVRKDWVLSRSSAGDIIIVVGPVPAPFYRPSFSSLTWTMFVSVILV